MQDVITIGSATRDIFVHSDAFETREHGDSPGGHETCMPLGAKIELEEMIFETGGGATNAAVTFARLGFKTACLTSVGDDFGSKAIKDALRKERCATALIQTKKGVRTGYSVIILAGSGERTVLVYRGASAMFSPKLVPWSRMRAKWFYISSLGGDMDMLDKTLAYAKKNGIHVAWNPGAKEIAGGLETAAPHIKRCDVLNLNLDEAAALVGTRDLPAIFAALAPLPSRAVIVTDGEHGAYASGREGTFKSEALKVHHINTTGAGDAFGSGLVAGLMKRDDLRFALALGTLNGAGVVQQMGAKRGILRKVPSAKTLATVSVHPFTN